MSDRNTEGADDTRPADSTKPADGAKPTEAPAPGQAASAPEQVPAARREIPVEVVGRRQGMFGAQGSGDTSGFGGLAAPIVLPGASTRPYGGPRGAGEYGVFDEVADEFEGALEEQGLDPSDVIEKTVVDRGELTFHIDREHLLRAVRTLRDDPALRFELCLGVSGVHYPGDRGRELHAVYHLRSITHNRLVRLEVTAPDADPRIPSVVSVYPTNDWHEREAYDFFGLVFDGHPALTRIMMPDDWLGHPQRKDYPLGGIPVEYKGAQIPAPDQRRSYS